MCYFQVVEIEDEERTKEIESKAPPSLQPLIVADEAGGGGGGGKGDDDDLADLFAPPKKATIKPVKSAGGLEPVMTVEDEKVSCSGGGGGER